MMGNGLEEDPHKAYYAIFNSPGEAQAALERIAQYHFYDTGFRHVEKWGPDDGLRNPNVLKLGFFRPGEPDLREIKRVLGAVDVTQNYQSVPC